MSADPSASLPIGTQSTRPCAHRAKPAASWTQIDVGAEEWGARRIVECSAPCSRAASTSLTLVVPVFNESHRVLSFAPQLQVFIADYAPGSELVFVDDGSSDGTPALVERFIAEHRDHRLRLLRQPHRGKGAAVCAGLLSATTDVAAFCDVDLATPLPELARVIDAATRAPILAIGSRGAATSRITRRQSRGRELLGRTYNRVVQLSLAPGIVDTQCGAKAATTDLWHKIVPDCREQGFAWDVELVARARVIGIPVQEVGIEWQHRDGSRINLVRDGIRMLRAIPRIRRHVRASARSRSLPAMMGGGTFDDESAAWLAAADPTHWWFRSKATFVSLALRRDAPTDGWLVDVGAGPGGVTAMLGWAPDRTLALEGNVHLVQAARQQQSVVSSASDAARLPLTDSSVSVVCLLDVIEHLDDTRPTLREATRVLRHDGRLIVNVPAHPGLWSAADEALGHARRYTLKTLRRELEAADLDVRWASHVFSWLMLPVWLRRRAISGGEPQLGLDVGSPLIDRLSMVLTRLEWSIASRLPLPLGTSILAVAAPRGAR